MGVIEHEVWIDASPAAVWRLYADPTRIPEWQTGSPVVEVVRGDGMSPGSVHRSRRGRLVGRTEVRESDPPRRLVSDTVASLGLRFVVTSDLRDERGGTRLLLHVRTTWPRGLGLLGRVVERALLSGGEAAKELTRLKALAESDSSR
jgi:uncharacterized protein YndB with AHSA1/START domain